MRYVRRRISVLALAAFGAGALLFFTVYRGRPQMTPVGEQASRVTDAWIDAVHTQAKNGYWLVVRGTHVGDQAVAASSGATLTHAALYDAEHETVIEAVGKGVIET